MSIFGGHVLRQLLLQRLSDNLSPSPAKFRPVVCSWKAHSSSVTHLGGRWGDAGFGGDALNDSASIPGWDTSAVSDTHWPNAVPYILPPHITLSADVTEPTVKQSSVAAAAITVHEVGVYRVQMQDLFTGWFEVANLRGAPGSTVHFGVCKNTRNQVLLCCSCDFFELFERPY